MKKKKVYPIIFVLILLSLAFTSAQGVVSAGTEEPPSEDSVGELTQPRRDVVVDTDEAMQGIQYPAEPGLLARAAGATFNITYVANGGDDYWEEPCYTFPEAAKGAFNYAAAIWAAKLYSPVPITIKACWANLGSASTLGYSGGGTLSYNFSGAPLTNTVYASSLANALHGSDLDPSNEDMHITYNQNFSWYYGLDGNPGAGKYDLVTVAAHEIGHGLNFSGSAYKDAGVYYWGYGIGVPNIYDTFMRANNGTLLTSYASGSAALGTLLTSNSLWFHGSNAMSANGSSRVKMYAPATWAPGSSYSHLDYTTFTGTINSMMVYSVSSNASQHNTGPVTDGLLKDLGWTSASSYFVYLPIMINDTGVVIPPDPILNGDFESGQVNWAEYSTHGWDVVTNTLPVSAHSGSW
ncbi:MAG: hypothetical protein MUO57_09125, partial [Anaerolineales bacterium]|nr:hypothetical protein [Anaerolineales bacterium]